MTDKARIKLFCSRISLFCLRLLLWNIIEFLLTELGLADLRLLLLIRLGYPVVEMLLKSNYVSLKFLNWSLRLTCKFFVELNVKALSRKLIEEFSFVIDPSAVFPLRAELFLPSTDLRITFAPILIFISLGEEPACGVI